MSKDLSTATCSSTQENEHAVSGFLIKAFVPSICYSFKFVHTRSPCHLIHIARCVAKGIEAFHDLPKGATIGETSTPNIVRYLNLKPLGPYVTTTGRELTVLRQSLR